MSCIAIVPPPPTPAPGEIVSNDVNPPAAVIRGGNYATGARNGIFAIFAGWNPTSVSRSTGFRCAR